MTFTLLVITIPLAYIAGWLPFSRWYYQLKRPYTEPLSCDYSSHSHDYRCYRRPGSLINSAREAAVVSALLGLVWPVMLAAYGFARLVTVLLGVGTRPLPAEVAAKTKRLECDDTEWRRTHGG